MLTNDSVKYWSDVWKKPFFDSYREGGMVFFKDGRLMQYQFTNENKRIITDNGSEDVICPPSTYYLKSDTLFISRCGWTFILKIEELTQDTLQLREITPSGYFPDFGFASGSIPIILIRSQDQITKPIEDYLDYTKGPVKTIPVKK